MQTRTGHRELSPGRVLTFTPSQPGCPSSETSELDGLGNLTKDTMPACGPTNSDPNESRAAGAKRNVHPNSLGGGADFNSPPLYTLIPLPYILGFPCSSVGKESACNAGVLDSIPGSGRSPGEGNGYPLQNSCLENLMDRGAW